MDIADRLKARLGLNGSANERRISAVVPVIPGHELIRQIGGGSYGEVWLARNIVGTWRAVKVVYRDHFKDARPYEREFAGIRKYEPLSRANEGLVDVLQIGQDDALGCFYYVMELADDAQAENATPPPARPALDPASYVPRTLQSELLRRGQLPVEECLELGLTLTLALGHLHRHGLIHRDVKPSNIIFVSGVPKLADVGLVTGLPEANTFVGTEGFVPPEGPNSVSADLYALGKVLYEAGMGKDRLDFPEPCSRLGSGPELAALMELNAILLKACATDPKDRYRSAEDLNADFALLHSGKSIARAHAVERRLSRLKKVSVIGGGVTMVALAALLVQSHQTRAVRRLESEARRRVVDLQMGNSIRAMNDSEAGKSLLWMTATLPHLRGDPTATERRRILIGSALDEFPHLIRLFACDQAVFGCAFSPDGARLACLSFNRVMLYDVQSGRLAFSVPCQDISRSLTQISFSADGRKIIVRRFGPHEKAGVYDAATGQERAVPRSDAQADARLLDCIDGRLALIGEGDSAARLWDLDSGEPHSLLVQVRGKLVSGRLAGDQRHVALLWTERADIKDAQPVARDHLRVWDLGTGTPSGPEIALDAESEYLLDQHGSQVHLKPPAWLSNSEFQVIQTETGQTGTSSSKLRERYLGMKLNSAGQWLHWGGNESGYSRLWNIDTGESVYLTYREGVRDVAFSPDGLLVSAATDLSTVLLWQRASGAIFSVPLLHARWAYSVAFSPDTHLLATTSDDRTVRIWDLATVRQPELKLRLRDKVMDAAFTPDGRRIVTLDLGMRLWDAQTGQALTRPLVENWPLNEITFSPSGRKFVTFPSNGVRRGLPGWAPFGALAWDTEAPERPPLLLARSNLVYNAEFSPDEQRIITAEQEKLAQVWDASTGEPRLELRHDREVTGATFHPDGRQIATSVARGPICFWDAKTGAKIRELSPAGPLFFHVAFSPTGDRLATAAQDQSVRLWSTDTLQPLSAPLFHGGTPCQTKFSPDGNLLLSWTRWGLRLWPAKPTLQRVGGEMTHGIGDAFFNKDGTLLVSCGEDGAAHVWDTAAGNPVVVPIRHAKDILNARFHPRGDRIITAGADTTAAVWRLAPCPYSGEQIRGLAELLSAAHLEDTGTPRTLDREEIPALYARLRAAIPDRFRESTLRERALWHEQMGNLAFLGGLHPAAIWHLDRALQLDPSLLQIPTGDEIIRRRGLAQAELGRWPEAMADLRKAVELEPLKIYNRYDLLLLLAAHGPLREYQQACAQALRDFEWIKDPRKPQHRNARAVLMKLCVWAPNPPSTLDEALRLADDLKQEDHFDASDWVGLLHYRAGQDEEAIKALEHARRTMPPDGAVLLALALSHQRAGHTIEAREIYGEAADLTSKPLSWADAAEILPLKREADALFGTASSPKTQSANASAPDHQFQRHGHPPTVQPVRP